MAIDKSVEIAGASNYPASRLRQRERKVLEVAEALESVVDADWTNPDPSTVSDAVNRLAAAFRDLLVKLDADVGVTDVDYESTLLP